MMRRTPDCLSDLRIDRLIAGDLEGRERDGARDHLAICATCAARVTAFEAARAVTPPDLETIRRIAAASPPRRPWRRLWPSR